MDSIHLLFGPDGWAGLLLQGTVVTLLMAATTVPFGFSGGLLIALLRLSRHAPVRALCASYTTFFRGIPDLLTLFIVYFGLQIVLDHVGRSLSLPRLEVSAFAAGVLALSAVSSAYSSEVWLSALKSVPKGQWEAAQSLGLGEKATFYKVVLPQMVRVAIPGLSNIWAILLKETSLMSTLAVTELLRAASEAGRATNRPLLFFATAAFVYLIISILSNIIQSMLEARSSRAYAHAR